MTLEEKWMSKYQEVATFIENNKWNPSKHNDKEMGRYLNWLEPYKEGLVSATGLFRKTG